MHSWPYPKLMAHRGAGKQAPENTLAALKIGYEKGYRSFECDVKLSSDGVPYLLHDAVLDRTTSSIGDAGGANWLALSQLDAGSWHSATFAGEPVPTLANIAAFVRANDCTLNIEMKPIPGQEQVTGTAVANAAAELWHGSAIPPLMSSFSSVALAAAQAAQPALPRLHLFDEIPADWQAQLAGLACTGLVCHWRHLTDANIFAVKAAGYRLVVYTCNDPVQAQRLLALGVDSVITDAVDLIAPN